MDDAHAHRRHRVEQGTGRQFAIRHQLANGEEKRHERAGDRRRARATVRLEHIAIHPDGARTQPFQINRRPHGPPDQALDLLGPPVDLALGNVALLPLQSGVGEHRILRRDPAAHHPLFLHPPGHRFLDRDPANDAGIAPLDQGRAGGIRSDMILKAQRTQLAGLTAIGADGAGPGNR